MNIDLILLILIIFDVAAFTVYLWDKLCAKAKWRRVPESLLLTLSVGGGLGGILAMVMSSHKIRKPAFIIINCLTCILQSAYLFYRAM